MEGNFEILNRQKIKFKDLLFQTEKQRVWRLLKILRNTNKKNKFWPQKLSYGKSRLHAKIHDNPSINMGENLKKAKRSVVNEGERDANILIIEKLKNLFKC